MTIAICIKVNDGVVLAADSASTLIGKGPKGTIGVLQVYENANKVFNLHKDIPVGIIVWGSGSVGTASIATLIKDFKKRITGDDPSHEEWEMNVEKYNIEAISKRFKDFIFDEHYKKAFKDYKEKPTIGFIIAGYSSGEGMAEEWKMDINPKGDCLGPNLLRKKKECGLTWSGIPEAISRLYLGFGTGLSTVLKNNVGLSTEKVEKIIEHCRKKLTAQMVFDAMPIRDAIDLAIFLVDTTRNFSKFVAGAPTVGGPTEVAAITKHEGYKWIKRNLYYEPQYNLMEE